VREPLTGFGHFARFEQPGHFGAFGGETASPQHDPGGRRRDQEAREGASARRRLERDSEADGTEGAQPRVRDSTRLRIGPQAVFEAGGGSTEEGDRMPLSGVTEQCVDDISGNESGRGCP
jgi:hypothetical protein